MDRNKIGWAAEMACLLEVSADKPGNVSRHGDFHDMSFEDFLLSASAIGPAFRNAPSVTVGETILRAIETTRRFVQVNTNLGIVILLAPLAKAAGIRQSGNLRPAVKEVLHNLTVDDTRLTYEAIRLAGPAGMGKSERYDLFEDDIGITLLQAMDEAKSRDSVASEYLTDFGITFEIGLAALRQTLHQGVGLPDAIVQTFLTILATMPDTLIARKKGIETAQEVSSTALKIIENGGIFSNKKEIRKFDFALRDKKNRLNPGTTADLIAAVLFVFLLEDDFSLPVKGQEIPAVDPALVQ